MANKNVFPDFPCLILLRNNDLNFSNLCTAEERDYVTVA